MPENETPGWNDIKPALMELFEDVCEGKAAEFMAILNDPTKKTVNLSLGVKIDCTEPETSLDVKISFGQRYKDSRSRIIGDPNQPALPFDGRRPGNGLPDLDANGVDHGGSENHAESRNGHADAQEGEEADLDGANTDQGNPDVSSSKKGKKKKKAKA